ncbi:MAG: ABC1 kinase family protein, partial [Thermodesulfobacteriota bacterium]
MAGQRIKNIRRLVNIVLILIKYGFGGIAGRMRIFPFVGVLTRIVFRDKGMDSLSVPKRIRLVLEDLGPTFVKLGQIASTRADVLPPAWVEEFKKLQDKVTPVPFNEIRDAVEAALGAPIENKFATFSETPVASASIAQVHLATLRNGAEVAVKVKRPGIGPVIASDMSVMHTLATLMERYVQGARMFKPLEVVSEFERVITKEQDLSIEGSNMERFSSIFEGNSDVQIPKVFWDYSTPDILTMERIYGTPIDEVEALQSKGV